MKQMIGAAVLSFLMIPSRSEAEPGRKFLGTRADLGLPEGVGSGVFFAPNNVFSLNLSYTAGPLGSGARVGAETYMPIKFSPLIALETGFVPNVGADRLVDRRFMDSSCVYGNMHAGLRYRASNFLVLFVQGGVTYISADTTDTKPKKPVDLDARLWIIGTGKIGVEMFLF